MQAAVETVAKTQTSGLSEARLARIQAVTGLLFATFLVLHLANTMLAGAGQQIYDSYQRAMRWYYQFAVVEIVCVVGSVVVHMWASATRMLRRRRRNRERARLGEASDAKPALRVRLHRWSGYVLFASTLGHILATRGPGLIGHPADFSFVNFSMTHAGLFFYPYYLILALSGLLHLAHGVPTALRVLGAKLPAWATSPRSRTFYLVSALGGVLLLVGVLGIGGNLGAVDHARYPEWKALYERVLPHWALPW